MRLDGKTALITGGASGIGRATVLEFARRGAAVICADVNTEKGVELQQEARRDGLAVQFAQVDLADPGSTRRCADQVLNSHPRVDILVNAAGWNDIRPTTSTGWLQSILAGRCTSPAHCCPP